VLRDRKLVLDDIEDAMRRIRDEDYEGALPILAKVVAFAPEKVSVPAYHLWAICHVRLGRMERALQLAEEGLARGILPGELQGIRAEALSALERFDEAAAAAEAAYELDPASPDSLLLRADVEIDRRRYDAALELLLEGRRRHPGDAGIHAALVEVAEALQRHPLVIEAARDFLRKFGKDAEVLAALGRAYVETRDHRRADRAFRDAAQLDPGNVRHHMSVLLVAVLTKNDPAYAAYLDRLGQRDPELAERAARLLDDVLARVAGEETRRKRDRARRRPGTR
jgi:tetratricopeptide (TPR) repeat protein